MGSHQCTCCYLLDDQGYHLVKNDNVFAPSSTGDVVLLDRRAGIEYILPDMALHYVHDHGWLPPQEFVAAVMNDGMEPVYRMQTKGIELQRPIRLEIGYLQEEFPVGAVPEGFLEKLEQLFIATSPDYEVAYRVKR